MPERNLILFNPAILIFFLLLFCFLSYGVNAQNNTIDSLKKVLLTLPDDTAKIRTYNKLITKLYGTGNYKEALTVARQSLELSQNLNFKKGIADAYNNIGLMYENLDNRDSALAYYFLSLKAREQDGGKKQLASTYNNIANIYNSRGNYIEAFKYHIQALKLREEIGDSAGMAISYNNIGLIYHNQNNYNDAIANFRKSLAISYSINDKRSQAMTHNNIANSNKNIGNYDEAILNINKAIELNKTLSNKNWLGKNYSNLGNCYKLKAENLRRSGDLAGSELFNDSAFRAFAAGLELQNPDENKDDYILLCNNMGEICIDMGKLDDAKKYNKIVLSGINETDNKKLKKDIYAFSSRLYSELANENNTNDSLKVLYLKNALSYHKKSVAAKDSLLNEDNTKQIAEIKTKYETEKKDNEIILLGKENELKSAGLKQRDYALQLAFLEKEKNQGEITLLNKDKDLQALQLLKTNQELTNRQLQTDAKVAELELAKKDKALKEKQLTEQTLYRNVIVVGSFFLLAFGLLLFNRFRLSKKIESQQALLNERKRISNELHDDVGSTLSSISIYSEAIKNKLNQNEPQNVMELVNKIGDNARETISNLSDIVWSINPVNDSGEKVFNRMESIASSVLSSKSIQLDFNCDQSLYNVDYTIETKQNVFLIFKEAINNAAKYSKATAVKIDIKNNDKKLIMVIADNGIGFNNNTITRGNGLKNMQQRAKELKGTLSLDSSNKGTSIELQFPLS